MRRRNLLLGGLAASIATMLGLPKAQAEPESVGLQGSMQLPPEGPLGYIATSTSGVLTLTSASTMSIPAWHLSNSGFHNLYVQSPEGPTILTMLGEV